MRQKSTSIEFRAKSNRRVDEMQYMRWRAANYLLLLILSDLITGPEDTVSSVSIATVCSSSSTDVFYSANFQEQTRFEYNVDSDRSFTHTTS